MSSSATLKLVFNDDIRRISIMNGFLLEELRKIIRDSFHLDYFVIELGNEQNHEITNQSELDLAMSPVFAKIKPNLRLIIKQTPPIPTFTLDEFTSMLKNASSSVASNAASSYEKVSSSLETLPEKLEGLASATSSSLGGFATAASTVASSSMEEASKNISSSYESFSIWFQQILHQLKTASEEGVAKNLSPHIDSSYEYVSTLTHDVAQNIAPTVENVQNWFCERASELKLHINCNYEGNAQAATQNPEFEEKLKTLEELGFGDRLLNQYLLESNNGDLEACIQQFLQ